MFLILFFLLVLSLVLTHLNYRISMFIFPDGVFVTRLQGFLGWYGWLNLFVSLPFLWDGDFKQGLYPFVLGAVPLLISIFLVFKDNDNRKVVFKRSARVYLNSDVKLIEPGDDTYGFLHNYKDRMRQIGPKYFFKEIFAREKSNKALADSLIDDTPENTVALLKSLSWVTQSAVEVKAQYIFLLYYMIERYDRNRLFSNFDTFTRNAIAVLRLLEINFSEQPYPIAKFIAQNNNLLYCVGGNDEANFVIEVDDYVCEDDENIIATFSDRIYHLNHTLPKLVKRVLADILYSFSKEEGILVVTNKRVVLIKDHKAKTLSFDVASYTIENGAVTFGNNTYLKIDNTCFFDYVMKALTTDKLKA